MLDYPQLEALVAVHRRGSFDLAAAALGVTPSAISQRIRTLEERMGCLLVRRGQPCTATETGLRLIRHAEEVALLERALDGDLARKEGGPVPVRIAVNADSLATWVIPALAAMTDMLFDVVIDDQDHSQDLLRAGEVAAAVTGHAGPLQGCDTIALGHLRYRATASPGFVAHWLSDGPDGLRRAPMLVFSDKDRLQHDWLAARLGGRNAAPAHRIASTHAFVDAALAGLGWGMNPEPLVKAHLATGRLVEVVADTPLDVALHWTVARRTALALGPLTRAIRQAARAVLLP